MLTSIQTWQFLNASASGIRERRFVAFAGDDQLSCDDVRDLLGNFDGVTSGPAKLGARLGQANSSSRPVCDLLVHEVHEVPDLGASGEYKDGHTDGHGMITEDLVREHQARLVKEEEHSVVGCRCRLQVEVGRLQFVGCKL